MARGKIIQIIAPSKAQTDYDPGVVFYVLDTAGWLWRASITNYDAT